MRPDSSHFFPPTRGFTLIELLLAIAIAAIALTIVNMTFFESHRRIESVGHYKETYQMVRIVMDRIIKDLSCAYVPSADREMTDDDISLYRFVGINATEDGKDKDSIYLTTTTDLGLPSLHGGICEVGYFLKEMEESQDRYYLIRKDDCTFHYDMTTSGREMELAENVIAMNIVYIDKDFNEQEEWTLDSALYLPYQVRVTITFAIGEEHSEFTGVASLVLSSVQLKKAQG
ncbi:MAG TPA: prepilin-type N-terminal cleavage/methylation domain-containing protein [Deltaproteobacteria bacterium]|nr:prepilin-type N-terminal cleavage/methylation domain-containing protein [Deltaproteobacteria bacterium]